MNALNSLKMAAIRRIGSRALRPATGPRALSYAAPPHLGPDGFVSKVYSSPEEALHDFTDGVKVPPRRARVLPSYSHFIAIHVISTGSSGRVRTSWGP